MKTAIVYMTKHGTTEKVANAIAKQLNESHVNLFNLREDKMPDIGSFDRVLIGGSIHEGMIQKRVRSFCESKRKDLLAKDLGLFLCCMEKGEKGEAQINKAFDDDLKYHAKAIGLLGGEFILEKMNFLEKAIVKKVSGVKETVSEIDNDAINRFVTKLN